MKILFTLLLCMLASLHAYEMGKGLKIDDMLQVGGYFSVDYTYGENESLLRLDDVAILGYGNLNDSLSYLAEFEAAPFYYHDYKTNTDEFDTKFHYERLYFDYKYSSPLNLRVGKQISPIGYWNLEPINVLRDTSSNPKLSSELFPKFLTGIDLYGYIPEFDSLSYHLFGQKTKDLDEEYINIQNKHFFGLSLENEYSYELTFGGSLGQFIEYNKDEVYFFQLNAKYDIEPLVFQFEAALNHKDVYADESVKYKYAAYLQTLYKINENHMLVGRYEYFEDEHLEDVEHIGVVGYSYRPIYPVSLKFEYQLNSHSAQNKSIISFSVLF